MEKWNEGEDFGKTAVNFYFGHPQFAQYWDLFISFLVEVRVKRFTEQLLKLPILSLNFRVVHLRLLAKPNIASPKSSYSPPIKPLPS